MITWDSFIYFAITSLMLWAAAIVFLFSKYNNMSNIFTITGLMVFALFIILFWISLERPPMRTMGETRLWYSFFLSAVGWLMYKRWKYRWIMIFSLVVASVFILINLLKPEIHSKNLIPALQSIWFVPHVTAYMLSYSFLSAATISAIILLVKYKKTETGHQLYAFTDNLVYVGFGLLMTGLLIGAVWAKEAWGHYWSWDPKETWAFVTAAGYLLYIHMRLRENKPSRLTLWVLVISFVFLMITWKGVNYLPTGKNSVHTYSQE